MHDKNGENYLIKVKRSPLLLWSNRILVGARVLVGESIDTLDMYDDHWNKNDANLDHWHHLEQVKLKPVVVI